MDKKGSVIIGGIILLVIIGVAYTAGSNISENSCRSDFECGQNYYCGHDNACHEKIVIEKDVVEYQLGGAASIIAIAIILAAIIIKFELPKKKREEPKTFY